MAISRSDMERQLRKDGGILTLDDARKMAPPGESLAYINPEEAALLKSLGGAGEDINGTGIKSYFLKKVFRKAKNVVKKVVKSPIGKAAILGGLTFGIPGTQFGGLAGGKGLAGLKGNLFGKDTFPMAGEYTGQIMLESLTSFIKSTMPDILPGQIRSPNSPPTKIPDLSQIKDPLYTPEREYWIDTLLANQFTMSEIEDGTAWKCVSNK